MANSDTFDADDFSLGGSPPTEEEIAAQLDAAGDPPTDEAEERIIRAFAARLRADRKRPTQAPSVPATLPSHGERARGKVRPPAPTVRLWIEALEDRKLSAFTPALNPLAASLGGTASLAIVAVGVPDGMAGPWAPIGQVVSAGPHPGLAERWSAVHPAQASASDTGAVDHYFSNHLPHATDDFQGPMTALPPEFLAEVRSSRSDQGGAATHPLEHQSIDQALAEAEASHPLVREAGRFLPEAGAVVLLGGLRVEPLRAHARPRAIAC